MSRGLGRFQQEILRAVADVATTDQVCWRVSGSPQDIPKSFYVSFRRAVRRLEQKGTLEIRRRKLETPEELARFYPWKTRLAARRNLRERLLPHVANYLEKKRGRFSLADNEKFLLARAPDASGQTWESFEDRLLQLAAVLPYERRGVVLQIVAKGRQFFGAKSGITCEQALGALITSGPDVFRPQHRELHEELKQFYVTCFPKDERVHTRLKSVLYTVGRFDQSVRRPWLTDELKEYLLEVDRQFVEALPGHEIPDQDDGWIRVRGTKFSPVLDELIGRDAFRSFEFLASRSQNGISSSS